MDHETEVIKQQMTETRTSLTEKLEALEEQVASTVRSTTDAVTGTAEAVKEAVEETVGSVKGSVEETVETVKETFDLRHQMEARPWLMLGGAAALGYLAGCLFSSGSSLSSSASRFVPSTGYTPSTGYGPATGTGSSNWAGAAERLGSGVMDRLGTAFKPALENLESLAIGAATSAIGEMLVNAAPEALRSELKPMLEQFTTALGGKPVKGLWNDFMAQHKDQPQGAQR